MRTSRCACCYSGDFTVIDRATNAQRGFLGGELENVAVEAHPNKVPVTSSDMSEAGFAPHRRRTGRRVVNPMTHPMA